MVQREEDDTLTFQLTELGASNIIYCQQHGRPTALVRTPGEVPVAELTALELMLHLEQSGWTWKLLPQGMATRCALAYAVGDEKIWYSTKKTVCEPYLHCLAKVDELLANGLSRLPHFFPAQAHARYQALLKGSLDVSITAPPPRHRCGTGGLQSDVVDAQAECVTAPNHMRPTSRGEEGCLEDDSQSSPHSSLDSDSAAILGGEGAEAFQGLEQMMEDLDNHLQALGAAQYDENEAATALDAAEARRAEAVATAAQWTRLPKERFSGFVIAHTHVIARVCMLWRLHAPTTSSLTRPSAKKG